MEGVSIGVSTAGTEVEAAAAAAESAVSREPSLAGVYRLSYSEWEGCKEMMRSDCYYSRYDRTAITLSVTCHASLHTCEF